MCKIEDQLIIYLSCSEKNLASCSCESSNFWPPLPLVHLCSFYIPPLHPQHMFALVIYPKLSEKTLQDAYEFLNEKSGSEKRENNYIFVNSTYKITMFLTQIYIYNKNKNVCMFYAFLIKKHFYMLEDSQNRKNLATAKQLIRKNSFCCLKNQAIFFTGWT